MAQRKNSAITLAQLIERNKLTVSAKIARRKLRKSSLKHDARSAWTFTPAQAKAALKVLAA